MTVARSSHHSLPQEGISTSDMCKGFLYFVSAGGFMLTGATLVDGGFVATRLSHAEMDSKIIALSVFILSASVATLAWSLEDSRKVCKRNYENIKDLKQMRKEAELLSFQTIVDEHTLEIAVKHAIVTPERLKEKFKEEYGKRCLSEVLNKYSFDVLEKYHLASKEFLRGLFAKEMLLIKVVALKKKFLKKCLDKEIINKNEFDSFSRFCDLVEEKLNLLKGDYAKAATEGSIALQRAKEWWDQEVGALQHQFEETAWSFHLTKNS